MYLVTSLMQTLKQTVCGTHLCSASNEAGHVAPQDSTATKNYYYYAGPQQKEKKK